MSICSPPPSAFGPAWPDWMRGGGTSGGDTGTADPDGDPAMTPSDIQAELRRAQTDFHDLVARATPQDLRRRSDGTRWTNRQLMWHMVFGYLIVRTLLPLVRTLGRLGRDRKSTRLNSSHSSISY